MTLKDGTVVERQVKNWHVQFQDAHGKPRRMKAGSKAMARELLAKMETEVVREKRGLPTQNLANIQLTDLRDRYLYAQKGKVGASHHKWLGSRINTILKETQSVMVRDLTPEKMEQFLIRFEEGEIRIRSSRARDEKSEFTPSARTVNMYLQAIRGMLNWAMHMRIIPYNPLACLKNRREDIKRKNRRALSEAELERLFEVARYGPLHYIQGNKHAIKNASGQTRVNALEQGAHNALLYRMLTYTGLRLRKELGQLRWADMDLEDGTLTIRAETTKSKRAAQLTVPPLLLEELRKWKNRRPDISDTDLMLPIPGNVLRTFNRDLKLAGIPKQDATGHSIDLHCLRHTYCTMLIRSGADIKTVQALMRHSTPHLTLGIYAHYDQGRMKAAVQRLPEVGLETKEPDDQEALAG
jgi:integrase